MDYQNISQLYYVIEREADQWDAQVDMTLVFNIIKSCQTNRVTPMFARMARKLRVATLQKCQLTPAKIANLEKKRLH